MTFSTEYLIAICNTLFPGLDATDSAPAIPSAATINLHRQLTSHLESHPDRVKLESALLAIASEAEPHGQFESLDEEKATTVLAAIEARSNDLFLTLLNLLAAEYYEHEVVLSAFGWRPSPPQPAGYQLAPMDEALLIQVKEKPPIWRTIPGT